MWSVDPTIYSDLLNVHGIAHKVVFDAEFSRRANQHMTSLPLYDPLDDDSVEAFRRRFLTNTFGIPSMSPDARPARRTVPRSSTSGSTPCGPACKTGSPRRARKSPTT